MKLSKKYKEMGDIINKKMKLGKKDKLSNLISLLQNKFKVEDAKDFIFYLIIQKFIEIIKPNKEFLDSEVGLVKEIDIECEEDVQPDIQIALSIPPYDMFGIQTELNNKKIDYTLIEDSFFKLIDSAKDTIYICSPFLNFNNLKKFQNLLIYKAKEKVHIKILTRELFDESSKDRINEINNFRDLITKSNLNEYIDIRDYHYSKGKIVLSSTHSKLVIIDLEKAYVGSGELRYNSFNKNFELGVIINNTKIVKELRYIFEILFSRSQQLR